MKRILVTCFLAVSFFSCNKDSADFQISKKMNSRIMAEEGLNKSEEIHKKRLENLQNDRYNLKKADLDFIKKGMKNVKSEQDLIDLWEKGGVKNAAEYIGSLKLQSQAIFESLHLDENSKNLTKEEKKELIRKSLMKNKDVNKQLIKKQK